MKNLYLILKHFLRLCLMSFKKPSLQIQKLYYWQLSQYLEHFGKLRNSDSILAFTLVNYGIFDFQHLHSLVSP